MNKQQLNDLIQEILTEQNKTETKTSINNVINAYEDAIYRAFKNGEAEVQLNGFGRFFVQSRKPRKGRNPRTGEVIEIPATKVINFKPSSVLSSIFKNNK